MERELISQSPVVLKDGNLTITFSIYNIEKTT